MFALLVFHLQKKKKEKKLNYEFKYIQNLNGTGRTHKLANT